MIYREENLWKEKFFVGRGKVFLFLERCFEKYFYFALDYEQGMIIGRMKGTLP